MPPRWNENRLSAKLGIDYPIIQGPLGGLSSQRLTAAVSNFGGLGSFGAHGLSPGAIKDVIAEIRSLTSKPFAMNLWVSMEDESARTSDEDARETRRAHRVDKRFHRKARTRNPQPLVGGTEPRRNGDSTLSPATKTGQEPRGPGRGGRAIGSHAPMDWAELQSFYLHRRVGVPDLIGQE